MKRFPSPIAVQRKVEVDKITKLVQILWVEGLNWILKKFRTKMNMPKKFKDNFDHLLIR